MSEKSEGHNGWKNYETWATALWIDNDEGSYSTRCEIAERIVEENPIERGGSRKSTQATRIQEMAGALEAMIAESMPDMGASLASDLLGAAMSEIDWYEIAENYIDDAVLRRMSAVQS